MKTPLITGLQGDLFDTIPKEHKPMPPKDDKSKPQKRDSSYVFDMMDALEAPILTFSTNWKDVMPRRILDIIPLARMAALLKHEELATLEECSVYIYTRSFEAPMQSEWVDIYTHISCKVLEHWFKEDHWEEVKAPRELSDWLLSQLNGLRRHIYIKRREMLKLELKNQEKMEKAQSVK